MANQTRKRIPFAKIVIGMAVSFLIGVGFCGLDFALGASGIGKSHEEFSVGPLDGVSLVVMVLSAAGLIVSLLLWGLAALFRSFEETAGPKTKLDEGHDASFDKKD